MVIVNTNTTPPVNNYTISISDYSLHVSNHSYSWSVNEGMYTVSVTPNNIVGSSEKTLVNFSKLIHIVIISQILLDAKWLQNINYKNIDITNLQAEVIYTVVSVA